MYKLNLNKLSILGSGYLDALNLLLDTENSLGAIAEFRYNTRSGELEKLVLSFPTYEVVLASLTTGELVLMSSHLSTSAFILKVILPMFEQDFITRTLEEEAPEVNPEEE